MRGHKIDTKPPLDRSAPRHVGVRELKARASGILREVREARASYVVTHRGRAIGVILPLEPEKAEPREADAAAAWAAFMKAGRALGKKMRPGVSGVQILSEMRR